MTITAYLFILLMVVLLVTFTYLYWHTFLKGLKTSEIADYESGHPERTEARKKVVIFLFAGEGILYLIIKIFHLGYISALMLVMAVCVLAYAYHPEVFRKNK